MGEFQTDKVARCLVDIAHLSGLKFFEDAKLGDFWHSWLRLLGDRREDLSEERKEKLLYGDIKNSNALKARLDHYRRFDEKGIGTFL